MNFEEKLSHRIDMHEKEFAIRHEYIEKSLNEGREKFKRIEMMLWGVYGMIVTSFGFIKLF